MSHFRTWVLFVCVLFTFSAYAQVPGELAITNPGFETGDLNGWNMWPGDDPKVSIVSDRVSSGVNAAKISGGTGAFYKILTSEVNLVPGTFYCFVAKVLNPSAAPLQEGQSVYLASKAVTPGGDVWFESAKVIDSKSGTDTWHQLSYGLTFPADATELTIEFKWTGTGSDDPGCVYVDDVKVIRMESIPEIGNLGFEDPADGLFDWAGGWWTWSYLPKLPAEGEEAWIDTTVSRSGDRSVAMVPQEWSLWSDDWWWGGFYSWTGYSLYDTENYFHAGDNFYMSAWVMTSGADPLVGAVDVALELTFKDTAGTNTTNLGYAGGRVWSAGVLNENSTPDEWHFLEMFIESPQWAPKDIVDRIDFNFVLRQYGDAFGTVYADDIFIARGKSASTDVKNENNSLPIEFSLSQNYPNPFNPATTIAFKLGKTTMCTLSIFNLKGEKIAELVSGRLPAGSHSVHWNAGNMPSGTYFYRLETEDLVQNRKMLLMR